MRFVFRIHKPRNVSTKRGCARSFGCESRCKPRRCNFVFCDSGEEKFMSELRSLSVTNYMP